MTKTVMHFANMSAWSDNLCEREFRYKCFMTILVLKVKLLLRYKVIFLKEKKMNTIIAPFCQTTQHAIAIYNEH